MTSKKTELKITDRQYLKDVRKCKTAKERAMIKKLYDGFIKERLRVEAARRKVVEEQLKRLQAIKKIKPMSWLIPAPKDFMHMLRWSERWAFKIKQMKIIKMLPFFKKYAITKPLYYMFIFFPNRRMAVMVREQGWDGTLTLNTQTKQLNHEKVWHFGSNACMFYNYDNAEPMDVSMKSLKACSINPMVYKENLNNNQMSLLLKPTEQGVTNTILMYVLIGIGIILL